MQQLATAEVKMEQKLANMMSELGTQLKQAEDTQLPLKRKKRQAEEKEGGGGDSPPPPTRVGANPMAKYNLKDFVGVLVSMRSLRVAFDDLMEDYRVYKNKQEEELADKAEAERAERDDDGDDGGDGGDDGGDNGGDGGDDGGDNGGDGGDDGGDN